MPVVGSAEIVVRAITSQVRGQIQRAFRDALPDIQSIGADHAKAYGDAFSRGLGGNLQRDISRNIGEAGRGAEGIGRQHGGQYGSAFNDGLNNANIGSDVQSQLNRIIQDAQNRISSLRSSGGGGGGGGGGGSAGITRNTRLFGEFGDEAVAASRKLTILIGTSNILGPAIGGLVSGISATVSGLFAFGVAAAQAAGAVAVIPGAISVAAQAFGALRLALSGVGAAVSAGMKPATASTVAAGTAARDAAAAVADAQRNLARAQADSARSIRDAQHGLSEAYRSAAIAAADAARQVQDAEADLLTSERDLASVRRELNDAYREGAEQLQQLAFDAEDAALAEERAGLRLQDAQAALQAVQGLPADDRARQEAELAFREAELGYRQAKDRASDLAEEQQKAARAGVEGTDAVVQAQQNVADATQNVRDNEQALADARQDQAETHHDNLESIRSAQEALSQAQLQGARSVADAQRALAKAQQGVTDAQAKQASSANAYKSALDQLNPSARRFAEYLVSLKDNIKDLKESAGEQLFPRLQSALEPVISRVFPLLQTQLSETGRLTGDAALGLTNMFRKGEDHRLRQALEGNNDILEIFTRRSADGENTFSKLIRVALRLAVAVQPLTERFARFVDSLIRGAAAATNSKSEMQGLTGFFNRAGDAAAQLGRIFGNLFDALGSLSRAALPAGQGLLDSFEKATRKLADFLDTPKQQTVLRKFFRDAAFNLRKIGDLIVAIGDEFFKLGDNRAIGQFAEGLIPAVRVLGDIIRELTNAAPALAPLGEAVGRVVLALSQSDGIRLFLRNLTWVVDKLADLLETPVAGKVLAWAAAIAAFTRVAALALIPIRFIGTALLGGPINAGRILIRIFRGVGEAFRFLSGPVRYLRAIAIAGGRFSGLAGRLYPILARFGPMFLRLAGPIGIVLALLPLIIKGLKALYRHSPEFRKFVDNIVDKLKIFGAFIKDVFIAGFKKLLSFFDNDFKPKLAALGSIIGDTLIRYVVPVIDKFFGVVNNGLPKVGAVFSAVFHVIGVIVKAAFVGIRFAITRIFMPVWRTVLLPAIRLFGRIFGVIFRAVGRVAEFLFKAIRFYITNIFIPVWRLIFRAIRAFFELAKTIFDKVRDAWSNMISVIKTIWERVLRPVIDRIKTAFQSIRDKVADVVNAVRDKFNDFRDMLGRVLGWVRDKVNAIKDKFGEIGEFVGNVFSGLGGVAKDGINRFIDFLNSRLIGSLNKVTSKFGLEIPTIPKLASGGRPGDYLRGGRLRGPGGSKDDKVAIFGSPNEYMVKASSARRVGYDTMAYINRTGKLPPMGDTSPRAPSAPTTTIVAAPPRAGFFGAVGNVLGSAYGSISNLAKRGVGYTLSKLIRLAEASLKGVGLGYQVGQGFTMTNLFHEVLNKLADSARQWGQGKQSEAEKRAMPAGGDVSVTAPGDPRSRVSWHGGTFTNLFVAHLKAAEKLAKLYIPVTQGGFRPATSYSGTSHRGDALDTIVNNAIIIALRRVGIAAGDRTGLGPWGPHVHAIPGPGAGYAAGSAIWQWQDYVRRGGMKQSLSSPWGLAKGGIVPATDGGLLALIGEAGRNERVEPLDSDGFSRRDKAILDLIRELVESNKNTGQQVLQMTVNPAPGMDERELAEYAFRRAPFVLRKGI